MARPRKKAPSVKKYEPDLQDTYTKRIDECERVISHLDTCPAWAVIKADLLRQKQIIDDNWWKLEEGSLKLQELRITALAYMHLLNITDSYQTDLDNAKVELDKLQNRETKIIKDYDNA
jgi:hypothetical protein